MEEEQTIIEEWERVKIPSPPEIKEITFAYLLIVIMLFGFFYPVIAGMQISSEYGMIIKWMPTWWFTY